MNDPVLSRAMTFVLFLLALVTAIVAFAYPFIIASRDASSGVLAFGETPILSILLISLCLAALLAELQGQATGAKLVASLGIMVAATSTLRFIEVGIPGPGGFSPIFAPIILGGYVFGSRFGFLLGAMTMFVSAIITGGVGPWLPYQMFTAGWVGLTAGWLPHLPNRKAELLLLAVFAFAWGFLYGGVMNLSTWPLLAGDPRMSYVAGAGPLAVLRSYATFYLATSLVWDLAAAIGNVVLLIVLGIPTINALLRFRNRMSFQVKP